MDRSTLEPLISDQRLQRITDILNVEFPDMPEDTTPLTYIQPSAMRVTPEGEVEVPPTGVLALMTPSPRPYARALGQQIMTTGGCLVQAFREAEVEWMHHVGKDDPALTIMRLVAREHVKTMRNLQEMT